jgi:regulator of sirC expression with transglutaminase-like and TPR domain
VTPFAELAAQPAPPLDALALAMAVELRPETDAAGALDALDGLGDELAAVLAGVAEGTPEAQAAACATLLGERHGFAGDRERYDTPDNSMLDQVLARRRGLPILLSVVYVEVARRAGVPLVGIGLPGHFVVGHAGARPPLLLDPFERGARVPGPLHPGLLRPWGAAEIAMRMLNNLVGSYVRRGNVGGAVRAAALRLALPADDGLHETLRAEHDALRAQFEG